MGVLPFRVPLPAGLATAVGALPQLNVADATRIVRELIPALPAGPSLVIGLGEQSDPQMRTVRSFLEELRGRVDPVVLSLTGPVTVHLELLADGIARDRAAAMARARVEEWGHRLLELSAQVLPGAPVLLFLEEPGLANSMHPTFPLSPDEIEGLVTDVVTPLSNDAMVGVQVGGRADWALLLRTGIGVLGAPITARIETAAAELSRFLESGGFVAWGAVPVDEPLGSGVERLWRRLSAAWADLARAGIDPLLLRERSIITPTGGLGGFGVSQAERVMQLAGELSERVFNQVVGARLSIGA